MPRITEQFIKALKPSTSRQIITDDNLKAFGVRVNTSGYMTYIVRYRIGKTQKIYTIGPVAAFTATQARQRAKDALADITKGIDPQIHKIQRREMPLFEEWVKEYLDTSQNASIRDERTRSMPFIRAIGKTPLDAISAQDIRKILKNLSDDGKSPATVNRHRSLIRKMFTNAIDAGIVSSNPVASIKPLKENNERTRFLSPDETSRLFDALESAPTNSGNAIRALYFTGRRKGEVLSMRWTDIDEDAGFWRIPHAKDRRTHNIPLTAPLLEIIENQKGVKIAFNPYVFPGRHGKSHIKDLTHIFKDVLLRAHIDNFRLHDLRHNYASQLAMSGHSLYAIGKLLGHSDLKTTRRYSHLNDQTLHETAKAAVIQLSEARKKQTNE